MKRYMTHSMGEDAYNELFGNTPENTGTPSMGDTVVHDGYIWQWDGNAFQAIGNAK